MRPMFQRLCGLFVVLLLSGCGGGSHPPSSPARYSIADLSAAPGGGLNEAIALNNAGEVVGSTSLAPGVSHAAAYRDGRVADLGTLPGDAVAVAFSVNDRGDIVGYSFGPGEMHFFEFRAGRLQDISRLNGALPKDAVLLDSPRLGPSGELFGTLYRSDRTFEGFLWRDGVLTLLGARSGIVDINARGQTLIGDSTGTTARYFLMASGKTSEIIGLSGTGLMPRKLGDTGEIVGAQENAGRQRAFVFRGGRVTDLGVLPGDDISEASDINAAGVIAGTSGPFYSDNPGGGSGQPDRHSKAVLWENGKIVDLNTGLAANSGWELLRASAINNRGQVLGEGSHNGRRAAFLLTPSAEPK